MPSLSAAKLPDFLDELLNQIIPGRVVASSAAHLARHCRLLARVPLRTLVPLAKPTPLTAPRAHRGRYGFPTLSTVPARPLCRQPASRLPVTRQKGNQDAQPHDAACTRRHTRDGSVARRARHSNNAGAQPRQSLCPNRLTHGPRHPLDTDALKMVPTRIYAWAPYLVLAERSCYSAASSSSRHQTQSRYPAGWR